jgi:hypothetical protein
LFVSALAIGCSASTPAAPRVAAQHVGQSARSAAAANEKGAPCPGRTVTSDAELLALSGCHEVQGDLRVGNVSSLEPLAGLERLRGELNISGNPELEDLEGLNHLQQVDALVLERNGFFTIAGLERVERIGRMRIASNPRLISIGGLNQARFVDEVVIKNNPRLAAYYGLLRGLERMPYRAVVEGNRGIAPGDTALFWQGGSRQVTARMP